MRSIKLFAALLMAVVCVSLSSCNKDDDEKIGSKAELVGKWQSTWERVHEIVNGKEVVTSDEACTDRTWEFKADGTCIEDGYDKPLRWSLKDNKLTLSRSDGYSDVLTVNKLTADELILAFEDWDNTDDGGEELDDITTTTYKKMN